jgi:hypothetical protein
MANISRNKLIVVYFTTMPVTLMNHRVTVNNESEGCGRK